jgi:hypothetical protein
VEVAKHIGEDARNSEDGNDKRVIGDGLHSGFVRAKCHVWRTVTLDGNTLTGGCLTAGANLRRRVLG